MNPLRHDFIRACQAAQPPLPGTPAQTSGLRYLDIGCGGGIFAESAARLHTTERVVGVDPSREVLTIARSHARQDPLFCETKPGLARRLEYINGTIESLPRPVSLDEQYDVVSLFEVLEHVASPRDVIAHAAPFVRPGGWLVGSTIARTWTSWLTTKVIAEDVLRIVPRGTHDWHKYIESEELRGMIEGKGGVDGMGLASEKGSAKMQSPGHWRWGPMQCMGVIYVPGVGWREVPGSEKLGNYFFAARKELRG